jgi:hypothetical protein
LTTLRQIVSVNEDRGLEELTTAFSNNTSLMTAILCCVWALLDDLFCGTMLQNRRTNCCSCPMFCSDFPESSGLPHPGTVPLLCDGRICRDCVAFVVTVTVAFVVTVPLWCFMIVCQCLTGVGVVAHPERASWKLRKFLKASPKWRAHIAFVNVGSRLMVPDCNSFSSFMFSHVQRCIAPKRVGGCLA